MKTENFIRLLAEDLPSRPVQPVTGLTRALLPAAGLAGAAFLILAGMRSDLLGSGLLPTLMKVFLGALLALAAIQGSAILSRPEASFAEGFRRLGAVITLLAVMLTLDIMFRGTDGWLARMFGKSIFSCLTVIPALALLPLAVSLHALRTGASTSPAAAGGLAGLASAGMAIIAYGVFCTEDSPVFVATWYSLAAILVAGLGAALGQKLLRW
jgi:hypothetical protein